MKGIQQTLKAAEVANNARDYYNHGSLIAQNPHLKNGYVRDNYRCAIGASLSPEVLEEIEKNHTLNSSQLQYLQDQNLVTFDSYSDLVFCFRLQRLHDEWYNRVCENTSIESIKRVELAFLNLIQKHFD